MPPASGRGAGGKNLNRRVHRLGVRRLDARRFSIVAALVRGAARWRQGRPWTMVQGGILADANPTSNRLNNTNAARPKSLERNAMIVWRNVGAARACSP